MEAGDIWACVPDVHMDAFLISRVPLVLQDCTVYETENKILHVVSSCLFLLKNT